MLRAFFASFVAVIFNILFLVSFLLFVALNTVLNVDFYRGDLSDKFYETVVDTIGTVLSQNEGELGLVFTPGEFENVLREVVKKEDFEGVLVGFIDQVINPQFDEDGVAFISLDLSGILKDFSSLSGHLAKKLYDTTPPCEQGANPLVEECIPEGLSLEDFEMQVSAVIDKQFSSSIPKEVVAFELKEQNFELFGETKLSKDLLWKVWWMTFSIELLLLFVIGLIILKPWDRVIRWISKPLLSGSVLVSVLFLLLYKLPGILADKKELAGEEFGSLLYFITDFFGLIAGKALIYSGAVFALGLGLYLLGLWMKHNYHHND